MASSLPVKCCILWSILVPYRRDYGVRFEGALVALLAPLLLTRWLERGGALDLAWSDSVRVVHAGKILASYAATRFVVAGRRNLR